MGAQSALPFPLDPSLTPAPARSPRARLPDRPPGSAHVVGLAPGVAGLNADPGRWRHCGAQDSSMDSGRGALAGTLGRFSKAMEDSNNRKLFWGVVGVAVALVLLFKILH